MNIIISKKELYDRMKTWDLLFFRGPEIVSRTIRFTVGLQLGYNKKSSYSHIGIIIRGVDFPRNHKYYSNKNMYVWESVLSWSCCGDGIKDVDGNTFLGVQLRNIDEVLSSYIGDNDETCVAYGKLNRNMSYNPDKLVQIFNKHHKKRYELNICNLVSAIFPCLRKYRKKLNSILCCCGCNKNEEYLFCSELVANVYKELDILPEFVKPENVLPADFIRKNDYETFDYDGDIDVVIQDPIKIKL